MILKPSIVVLGSSGQLGNEIANDNLLQSNFTLNIFNKNECDITDFQKVETLIRTKKPKYLINCAAYTNVDKAELEKGKANLINNISVSNLAKVCEKFDVTLIHFSTDYVFSGDCNKPIKEENLKNPINYYGYTKHLGEEEIFRHCKKFFLFRISWVYSTHGNNFPNKIISLIENKNNIRVVDDQVGSPTPTSLISSSIGKILISDECNKKFGVYHLSPDNFCSWFDIAKKIHCFANDNEVEIIPVSSKEFKTDALRPSYSCLNNEHFKKTFKIHFKDWNFYMDKFLERKYVRS